jgi:hypothetical protein
MDSKTQPGNGLQNKRSQEETSVILILLKKFTDSPQMTRVSSLNHGEESKNHIKSMDSRIQIGNGSINLVPSAKNKILVMLGLMKEFTVLPLMTRVCYHNPGEELRSLIQ